MKGITGLYAAVAASAAAISLAAASAPAQASEITLSVAGLDFHNPADLAAFNDRVQTVAHRLCAEQAYTGTRVANQGACIRAVVQEAFENLDAAHRRDIALAGDKLVSKGLASR